MKKESKIHNTGFLISPTTHLFPLAGQSGSHGVSSMINFEIKIWNNAKLYKSIQYCMSVLNQSIKKGKYKKVKQTQIHPRGMGSGLERAYSKKDFLLLLLVTISVKLNIRIPLVLILDETKILQRFQNFKILVRWETHGGI